MANTDSEITAVIHAVADCCTKLKQANSIVDQTLHSNTVRAIDWNSQQVADLIAAGDHPFSGQDVSNAIGSLTQYDGSFYSANAVNLEKLCKPIV